MDDNIDYSEFRIITDKIQEELRHKLVFVEFGDYHIIKINDHILKDKDMVDYIGLMSDEGLEYNEILSGLPRKVFLCANTMTTTKKLGLLYIEKLKTILPGYVIRYDEIGANIIIKSSGSVIHTGILSMQFDKIGLGINDYLFNKPIHRSDCVVYMSLNIPINY